MRTSRRWARSARSQMTAKRLGTVGSTLSSTVPVPSPVPTVARPPRVRRGAENGNGEIRIPAADAFSLAATLHGGDNDVDQVILIAPATGVSQRVYHSFARYLVGVAGSAVITWDWRGTGRSQPEQTRGFRATMWDWAIQDLPGVIAYAEQRFPGARIVCIGHGFGGQAVGLAPNADRVAKLVTIAAPSGYWGHWPRGSRYRFAALWYVGVPMLTSVFGYLPGEVLGAAEDLPAGVALEWARWCRSPSHQSEQRGLAQLGIPVLALAFADDAHAPREAVEALHGAYGSSDVTTRFVAPDAVGVERIGHLGFFRSGRVPALWRTVARWLQQD